MRGSTAIAVVLSLVLLSCGDETTINNTVISNAGTIIGHLDPPDPGAVVITGDGVYSTTTDEDGQFTLAGVQPGLYSLEVRPIQYSVRKLETFKVAPNQLVDLGTIVLSHDPYPIYLTYPPDGDDSVPPNIIGIHVYVDEPLNMDDLHSGSRVTPPLAGHWEEHIIPYYPFLGLRSFVEFVLDDPYLALATHYELTIDPTVRTEAGVPIGDDVSVEFTTQDLQVNWVQPRTGFEGRVGLTDFRARVVFNTAIEVDSLNKAAVFEPELEGVWIAETAPTVFTFLPTQPNPLKGSTTYRLIVADDVALTGAATLPAPDTMGFETEPYRIEAVDPCNGCSSYGYGLVRVEFNTAMDTASVESAFSLRIVGDTAVGGEIQWRSSHRVMLFWATDRSLEGGRAYHISLPRSVLTADGHTLHADLESYFTVDSD